jgi:DNA repair exonuclease SbcCD ATPase subunit
VTSILRIDAAELDTTEGAVRYEFPSDLTVLAGPTGVGKTTLLEMIKYGLGCTARLSPVATDNVKDVTVEITIGSVQNSVPPSRLRITRSIDQQKSRTARVTDLTTQERLPDHQTGDGAPSLSSLLMAALGLPSDMRAASRTAGSGNAGNRITFADVMTFLYVRQAEINHDIAHSQDSYREPKRKVVFELLYELTNPDILKMRSDLNALNAKVTAAEAEYQNVVAFLRASRTASRTHVEQDMTALRAAEAQAEADQAALRHEIDPVTDRETLTLRDLLSEAERSLTEARDAVTSLGRQQADYSGERRRVQADLDRYRRMLDAGERLASIEFSVCPRCMQSLTQRPVPDGACRVCLQPDPVTATETEDDLYETRQLRDQIAEMDGQLASTATQAAAAAQGVTDREQLVKRLSAVLDERTAQRVSPRLQAFSDAVQRLATARARQRELELVLRQWDRADDIGAAAEQFRADRERLRSELTSAQNALDARRSEILDALNEEFRETVRALGIQGHSQMTVCSCRITVRRAP